MFFQAFFNPTFADVHVYNKACNEDLFPSTSYLCHVSVPYTMYRQNVNILGSLRRHAWIERGMGVGDRGSGPQKNHKNIGFLSNIGPDPLKNHKDTK